MDVHIDEARGDDQSARVDDAPGSRAGDAVDRGHLAAGDPDVQSRAGGAAAVDDIAAGDEDVEVHYSSSSFPA